MEKLGFNLLRPQITPEGRWDKIYSWVNSTARVIVIFVELIVLVSFGARIFLDTQARDLERTLAKNKVQLDSLKQDELEIIELQGDITNYLNLWETSSAYSTNLREIYNYNPNIFLSLTVRIDDKGDVNISGIADGKDVMELERIMKKSDTYSIVEVLNYRPGENIQDGEFQIRARVNNFKRGSFFDENN